MKIFGEGALLFGYLISGICTYGSPLRVSVTAISDDWAFGYYEPGVGYTFSWDISDSFENNGNSIFNAQENTWADRNINHTPIFSDVFVDGLLGHWTRPSEYIDSPSSRVSTTENHPFTISGLTLVAAGNGTQNPSGIGLSVIGDGPTTYTLHGIQAGVLFDPGTFQFPNTYTAPTEYLSLYEGAYSSVTGIILMYASKPGFTSESEVFTITSMTISAIPEPSSLSLLIIGGFALCFQQRLGREPHSVISR